MAFSLLNAQGSYKSTVYKAYISNDMTKWKVVIDQMESQTPKSNDFLLELINYQYGYIGWCIGNDKKKDAKIYLELGEKYLKALEDAKYKLSEVNAYKSAFYGYRIGLNKLQAPFLGPQSVECAKLAIKLDAKNPYGYIQIANSEFYMPPIFGGSKTVALENYQKAANLMESKPEQIVEDWNYLSLLTMVGQSYQALKKNDKAKSCYEKILKIEPNFLWVKNELYPEISKKLK